MGVDLGGKRSPRAKAQHQVLSIFQPIPCLSPDLHQLHTGMGLRRPIVWPEGLPFHTYLFLLASHWSSGCPTTITKACDVHFAGMAEC